MTEVVSSSVDESEGVQGSSEAKDLADYAAMPKEEKISDFDSENGDPGNSNSERKVAPADAAADATEAASAPKPREIGGRDGPEPTRFGDWEKSGRCIDF